MATTTSEAAIASNYALVDPTITQNQATLVVGPDYVSRKYSDAALRPSLSLGEYTGASLASAWPAILAGETVDLPFTQVTVEDSAQRFYTESTRPFADANGLLTGYLNRVRISDRIFKTANGFTRSGQVPVDVEVGDWLRVSNGTDTVVGHVTKLIADIVLATVTTPPTANSGNIATNAGASGVTPGGSNTSTAVSTIAGLNNPANYQGAAARQASETYTITVTTVGAQGTGISGDWTTVRLSVVSTSGTDPAQTNLIPAVATPLSIGSRGARVQWSHGGAGNDWVLGDVFTLTVTQAYTIPTPAAGGTYVGAADATYMVRVTKGGATSGSDAQVSVTTSTGSDVSGPHLVTTGVAVPIGTKGVTITFTGATLFANDLWLVPVTAQVGGVSEAGGAIRTLELDTALDSTVALFQTNWVGQNVTLEIAVPGTIDLPKNRIGYAPTQNWTPTASLLTIAAGAVTYTDRTGVLPLSLVAGTAYATYRALRSEHVGEVLTFSSDAELLAAGMPDPTDPDNILSHAFHRAFAVTETVEVKGITVPTYDLAGYTAVIPVIIERPDWKTIVGLTDDEAIIDLLIETVDARSGNTLQLWSDIVVPVTIDVPVDIVKLRSNGAVSTATIVDDPLTGATDYELVIDTLGVFLTRGVRAGDEFRTAYSTDGFGTETYTGYVIESVASNNQLRLVAGPASQISPAIRYEIWRTPTIDEQVSALGAKAASYANSRVIPVFPDGGVNSAGATEAGFMMAADIAGLRSAAAPHQGLVTVALEDWSSLPSSTTYAGKFAQLDQYGMYVVRQLYSGEIMIDSAYTSKLDDPTFKYDNVRRNLDACQWYFKGVFERFRGHTNVVEENLTQLSAQFQAAINFIKTASKVDGLGSMIISGTLTDVRRHATLANKIVVTMVLVLPAPLEGVEFEIQVVI